MKNHIPLLLLLLVISACKKDIEIIPDNSPIPTTVTAADYLKADVGNYWVYESTQFGSTQIDSSVVTKDTLIGGNSFAVIEGHDFASSWKILNIVRDSSNYIINEKGQILFTLNNFVDTLNSEYFINSPDTFATVHYKMYEHPFKVTVPAGEFENTLNYRGDIYYHSVQNMKYNNAYYCKDIGLIHSISPYSFGTDKYEKKLLRYYVK